jgi:hypothetical protein
MYSGNDGVDQNRLSRILRSVTASHIDNYLLTKEKMLGTYLD